MNRVTPLNSQFARPLHPSIHSSHKNAMALSKITINADMGESLGKWRLGEDDDADIMP